MFHALLVRTLCAKTITSGYLSVVISVLMIENLTTVFDDNNYVSDNEDDNLIMMSIIILMMMVRVR